MKKLFTLILLSTITYTISAQNVMTVGSENVDVKEFKRVYEKNILKDKASAYTRAKLDSFTTLYSMFLMKLQEAKRLKLDTSENYKREVAVYKGQLANKYNNDDTFLDQLAQEEYQREKNEWNLSHILIKTPRSGVLDTADAIAQLNQIRNSIAKGDITFEEAVKLYSQDDYTKNTEGKIGWATAMQTPYTLETAFVNTPKGKISEPAFSPYGVHLIKVNDMRPNFGTIKVSQILIEAFNVDSATTAKAKVKAQSVYDEIKKGKISFEDAVKKYSQDEYSNKNNGELAWFGPGENVDAFENAAVSMKVGDVSQPVYTSYGYHIIRKDDQKPLVSYEERKPALIQSISNSDRGKLAKQKSIDETRKRLKVKEYQTDFINTLTSIDSASFAKGKISDKKRAVVVYSVENEMVTFGDVFDIAVRNSSGRNIPDRETFIKNYYAAALNNTIQKHEIDYLSANNPEFKNLLKDYEDGILIFSIMEKNVWSRASQDSLGQVQYYEAHKDRYQWNNAVEYDVYTAAERAPLDKLASTLGKITSVPSEAVDVVNTAMPNAHIAHRHKKQEVNTLDPQVVAKLSQGQPSNIIEQGGQFELYVPIQYSPTPTPKTFAEARSYVLSDYQAQLEQEWNDQLRREYPVKINTTVYESMIK